MTTHSDDRVAKLLARRTLALIVGYAGLFLGIPLGVFLLGELNPFLGWTCTILYFSAALASLAAGFVAETKADKLRLSE